MDDKTLFDSNDNLDYAEVSMWIKRGGEPVIHEILKAHGEGIAGITNDIPLSEYDKERVMESYCLQLADEAIADPVVFAQYKTAVERKMADCPLVTDFEVRNHAKGVFAAWRVPPDCQDEEIIGGIYVAEVQRAVDAVLCSQDIVDILRGSADGKSSDS